MKNPFGSQQVPGSYFNLKERIYQKVRSANVNDRIIEIVQKACEGALEEENLILSRAERVRLFSQILKQILEDALKKSDDSSKSA